MYITIKFKQETFLQLTSTYNQQLNTFTLLLASPTSIDCKANHTLMSLIN